MKTIRALILGILVVTVAWGAHVMVHAMIPQVEIIVVHTGESKTLHYNPETHEEVRNEMADGNVMLTVKPKEDQ